MPREDHTRYPDGESRLALYDRLLQRIGDHSGVALATSLPPYGGGLAALEIQGQQLPGRVHDVGEDNVSPAFFDVLGVPLLRGRLFDAHDRENTPAVAIVNKALVREYFRDFDPIGRPIRLRGRKSWLTVIGVVGNLKHAQLMDEMSWSETPVYYRPLSQNPELG